MYSYERIVLIINTKYEASQREPCLGGVRSDLSSTVLHDSHDTTGREEARTQRSAAHIDITTRSNREHKNNTLSRQKAPSRPHVCSTSPHVSPASGTDIRWKITWRILLPSAQEMKTEEQAASAAS